MAYQFPESLSRLVSQLAALPGVGRKAAQRLAFHLLADENALALSDAIREAKAQVRPCPCCGNFTDEPLCAICRDTSRDSSTLCVVESVADLISMERSGVYKGRYHVLGGVISPMDGVGPDALRIPQLLQRLEREPVKEIIMATNPTAEGEATAEYLAQKLRKEGRVITRLAHGMPVGGTLAFVDEATLDLALSGRRSL